MTSAKFALRFLRDLLIGLIPLFLLTILAVVLFIGVLYLEHLAETTTWGIWLLGAVALLLVSPIMFLVLCMVYKVAVEAWRGASNSPTDSP